MALPITRPLSDEEAGWLPADDLLGPAMKSLEGRHRLFVVAMLEQGVKQDAKKAAVRAGYSSAYGKSLFSAEKIQAALLEESKKRLHGVALSGATLIRDVVNGTVRADVKTRLKATEMAFDRIGLHSKSESLVQTVNHSSREEKLLRLAQLARLLGQDPKELLGSLADTLQEDYAVIDVTPIAVSASTARSEVV